MASSAPAKKPSRLGLFLPFVFLLIFVAAWSAWWFIAAGRINQGVDRWIEEQAGKGVDISYKSRSLGGYPFRFELVFNRPIVEDHGRDMRWEGDQAEFVMQAWNLTHMIGRTPGHNLITEPDGMRNSIDLDAHAAFSLSWGKGGVKRFGLQSGEASALVGGRLYDISGLSLNLAPRPESPANLMIALQWEKIRLDEAPYRAPYLGTELGPSRLIGEVEGFFPAYEAAGRKPGGVWSELLDKGGAVNIGQLLLNWGPLDLGAKADVKLADGAANGTIDVRLEDAEALKQAMIAAGHWSDGEQLAIGALETTSADGGFLTLTVRDNKVFIEPFLLWELPGSRS